MHGREFARYGQIVDYVITLTNGGSATSSGVTVMFALSEGLDWDNAHATCLGAGDGASCTSSGSVPLQFTVTLPPDRSLTWLVSVPVRSVTPDATIGLVASATGAATVADTDTLVLFRDGVDVPYGDGTRAIPIVDGEEARAVLDGDTARLIDVPAASSVGVVPLLILRDDTREVRVDRASIAGNDLVRLAQRVSADQETASEWSALTGGALLELWRVDAKGDQADVSSGALADPVYVLEEVQAGVTLR